MAGWDITDGNLGSSIDQDTGFINNSCTNNNNEGVVTLTDNTGNTHDYFYNMENCSCGDDTVAIYLDDWGTGSTAIANETSNLRLKSIDNCDVVAMRSGTTSATTAAPFESSFNFKTSGGHSVLYKMFDTSIVQASGFTACGEITRVFLGKNVNSIGEYAFASDSKLGRVCAPGVSYIGLQAFVSCTGLTSFSFNTSGLVVAPAAFANCYNLTNFSYNNDCDCTNTNSRGFSFSNVASIGVNSFRNCSGLTGSVSISFNLPIGSIDNTGFSALTIYSDNIDITSFNNCANLEEVVFAKTNRSTTISGAVNKVLFSGCSRIISVTIRNDSAKMEIPENCTAFPTTQTVTVYVPSALLSEYRLDSKWNVGNNVTFIGT